MIFKIKIKKLRKTGHHQIYIWIEKHEDFEVDIEQMLKFFEGQLKISHVQKLHGYYKITASNPAILLSLISTINDLIPEIYFIKED